MNEGIHEALIMVLVADLEAINIQKEAREKAITLLRKAIMETPKKAEKPTQQEIDSLKSVEKVSSKGPYQLLTKEENTSNPAFDKLRNYISAHEGFVTIYGLKLWNFNNSDSKIGYKK